MDLLSVGCHSTCLKLIFLERCSLRLNLCLSPCNSSCVNLTFAHTCTLSGNGFSLQCNLLYVKMIFIDSSSVILDVLLLSYPFTFFEFDFVKIAGTTECVSSPVEIYNQSQYI